MAARARRETRGGARSGWTWRRALALALCLLVSALVLRPHPVEARTDAGVGVAVSSGISGGPVDADGGPAAHCAHCGCAGLFIACSDAPRLSLHRSLPRFTAGARAGPDAASIPEAPPPRP